MLKTQRDGTLRPYWYGVYTEEGKRKVINLDVPVKGTPPPDMSLKEMGDSTFERSRALAESALKRVSDEIHNKGRAEHLTERLIESKTGQAVQYTWIDALAERWRNLGREAKTTEAHLKNCDEIFSRFVEFMRNRKPAAKHLYEVNAEDAAAFVAVLQMTLARKSVRDNVKLLNKAFERFLPVGAVNPFAGLVGHRAAGESETIHRKPFSEAELRAILDAAKDDPFMYPLIVTAACTGMRRGDVCELKWEDVDLKEGMLAVKTSKTGAGVEIPIFPPLRKVLEGFEKPHKGLVYPEAAAMLEANPDGLTWRFKKIVAMALCDEDETKAIPSPATEVEEAGIAAIREMVQDAVRQDRIVDTLRRYCAGASVRQIVTATGYCKATVSGDLHAVERLIGRRFLRVQATSIKRTVKNTTQATRGKGQRMASVRDWHALRATWVTLALSAGVPVELVRRVTGHATVEVVLKHYFRPDREQFRAALTGALPDVLTGGKPVQAIAEGESSGGEMAELLVKIRNDSATAADKKRFKTLAAKV
jgi:integrase